MFFTSKTKVQKDTLISNTVQTYNLWVSAQLEVNISANRFSTPDATDAFRAVF